MSTNSEKNTEMFGLFKAMVGIGIICAALIASSYQLTQPRIKKLKAEALEKAVFEVLPGMEIKKTFVADDKMQLTESHDAEPKGKVVYAGYTADGKLVGVAVLAKGMGFADVISIIYGCDIVNEKIIGYQVLESKETPGLGDKIEKDQAFLMNFKGLSVALEADGNKLVHEIATVKNGQKKNNWEIDGITGATISSRAIGAIFKESSEIWMPVLHASKEIFMNNEPKDHVQ